jgi:hypothetical protein
LTSGSISDPFSFDSGFGWWEEFGFAVVGVEPDFPRGIMNHPMMVPAQQHEVLESGFAAQDPVEDVVGVAHDRGPVAAGERAVLVT